MTTHTATYAGQTFSTNSKRAYTHAVLARRLDGTGYDAVAWSSSEKGAESARKTWIGYTKPDKWSKLPTDAALTWGTDPAAFVVVAAD